LRGRSHCGACGHVLGAAGFGAADFLAGAEREVPLLRRGNSCALSVLTELLCAAAFVGVVLRYDVTLLTAQYLILTVLLLIIALVDYDTGLIPRWSFWRRFWWIFWCFPPS
jgi:leader peptidase (prepilin peptidase)/N-methyltransferase